MEEETTESNEHVPIKDGEVIYVKGVEGRVPYWFQYEHMNLYVYTKEPVDNGNGLGYSQAYDIIENISPTEAVFNILNYLKVEHDLIL